MNEQAKRFSIREALSFGFYNIFEQFPFFLTILLVQFGIGIGALLAIGLLGTIISGIISAFISLYPTQMANMYQMPIGYAIALALIAPFLRTWLMWGADAIYLEFCNTGKQSIKTFFSPLNSIVSALIADTLYWLMFIVGLCLFVLPGLYFATIFSCYRYIMLDTGCRPLEAFKKSAELTKGARFHVFAANLVVCLVGILGVIPLLNVLVIFPALKLALIHIYQKLRDHQELL